MSDNAGSTRAAHNGIRGRGAPGGAVSLCVNPTLPDLKMPIAFGQLAPGSLIALSWPRRNAHLIRMDA